jgi:hypothetical protein
MANEYSFFAEGFTFFWDGVLLIAGMAGVLAVIIGYIVKDSRERDAESAAFWADLRRRAAPHDVFGQPCPVTFC